jgi:hypothetical protein
VPEPTRTLIVSPDGQGKACQVDAPCALKEGLAQVRPGEAVYLRGGVYYQGDLRITQSGTPDLPIMVQSYPGEQAVLDGAEQEPLTWVSEEAGIYSARVMDSKTNTVFADDQRLYPYKTLEDLQQLIWNLPGYAMQGNQIFVHLTDGLDPSAARMAISRYPHALWIEGDYVYVMDLSFQHYSEDRYQQGAVHLSGSNGLVEGNNFAQTFSGVAVESGANNNLIQKNTFTDAIFEWPWDAAYDGTYFPANGGVRFISNRDDAPLARGNVIRRNVFHDLFDGFHICPDQTIGNTTNETDVYENSIYRVTDDGMETDGYCSNVRIWGNTIHDVLMGVSLAPARMGPTYVIRNLVYNTGVNKYPPQGNKPPCCGGAIKLINENPSGYMYLIHNTGDSGLGSPGFHAAGGMAWSLLYSRNNIWIGKGREAIKYNNPLQPMDLDYDLLQAVNGNVLVVWQEARYRDLSSFQKATGLEMHGFYALVPGFSDPSTGDYRLTPGSALIDIGLVIPGINDGYQGGGPDLGAFEVGGAP